MVVIMRGMMSKAVCGHISYGNVPVGSVNMWRITEKVKNFSKW